MGAPVAARRGGALLFTLIISDTAHNVKHFIPLIMGGLTRPYNKDRSKLCNAPQGCVFDSGGDSEGYIVALTKRRRAFVEHYLQCFNATEAAKRAEYSPKTAYSIGHELLKIPEVSAAIEARLNELKMQADEVLVRLTDQARGSMADFVEVDESGDVSFNLSAARDAKSLHLVKKIKKTVKRGTVNETTIEIELYDAQAALAHLARVHGLYQDKVQVDWRIELEQAGLNPDVIESELVAEFERHIRAGKERADLAGAGDGESTGTSTVHD